MTREGEKHPTYEEGVEKEEEEMHEDRKPITVTGTQGREDKRGTRGGNKRKRIKENKRCERNQQN